MADTSKNLWSLRLSKNKNSSKILEIKLLVENSHEMGGGGLLKI